MFHNKKEKRVRMSSDCRPKLNGSVILINFSLDFSQTIMKYFSAAFVASKHTTKDVYLLVRKKMLLS